ncbi:phospholipase [Amylibacter ulvae]|uniref:Phospholipase n=1 Tax=Paramylibacter ulvae TaxID=1651968 RepID=A0ABQ3CTL2_9RHOB|nr:prolyl oligopeptidase family serine peptidase [Amylibacter ulvae]GHA43317.1 phospholipase [Amylibacter ulvae]
MTSLTTHTKAAQSGKPDSMVIFLHGYGADGQDLLGLADPLASHLPNTVFLSPDAPNTCSVNPMGYEWFPIPWLDGSPAELAELGMREAVVTLNTWLDEMAVEHGVSADRTVLVGFSQGTMMSLHVAPRRTDALAGVVGFSGRLLNQEDLAKEAVNNPPVMLIHGDADDVVPYDDMAKAANGLASAGFEVYTHTSKGTAHGIAPDGLSMALQFIKKVLRE